MIFKIKMDPRLPIMITQALVDKEPWLAEHKDEIISLVKKGWTNPQKIIDYLKKKYNK